MEMKTKRQIEALRDAITLIELNIKESCRPSGMNEETRRLYRVLHDVEDRIEALQRGPDEKRDARFWECKCKKFPVWSKRDSQFCTLCHWEMEDDASASVEAIRSNRFATEESFLIAYNTREYYDHLDMFG